LIYVLVGVTKSGCLQVEEFVEGSSDCGDERCESDVHSDGIAVLFSRVLTTDVKYFLE
jgi:hypothetical protein